MVICPVCKKNLSKISPQHLSSKAHKEALQKLGLTSENDPAKAKEKGTKEIESPLDGKLNEILLFTYLSRRSKPKFNDILSFLTSFNISTEAALQVVIKKLKDGDLAYSGSMDQKYKIMLEHLIFSSKFHYPTTMTMKEAFQEFHSLGYKYADEFMKIVDQMTQAHPSFLLLSSSEIGSKPDLITFKQIFEDNLVFELKKNWVL